MACNGTSCCSCCNNSASSTSIASIVTVFFIAYFIVKVFGLHYIYTFILMCKGPMPQLLSVHRSYCVYREYRMNLEGKELPKSLWVQLICEWLTTRHQTMLSPNPHTSVTSLCAETMQSGRWALSVISWWKKYYRKACARSQQSGLSKHCFLCEVLAMQGQGECVTIFSPLFIYLWLACLVWLAVWQNLFCRHWQ